ncbi:hypothetical protein [Ancylobacter radicis]|uniref:Uncharacterized protein n=1 Tax=Ancylobacter radicis TaxID=2836179 RepID=A0ABS5R244_9HYPH|nr:hypothetical protein [Ancylobacter radicis]MBS9475729.1 hypothetical protein [Ancylobacter radicis]
MAMGLARSAAVALVIGLSGVSLLGVEFGQAQDSSGAGTGSGVSGAFNPSTRLNLGGGGSGTRPSSSGVPVAPVVAGSSEQRAATVKAYVAALVAAQRAGNLSTADLRGILRDFVVANQSIAGEVVAAIVAFSSEGAPGISPNLSLTQLLADGVALGVAELQVSAPTSPAAAAALQAINQTFADAGVSRGSAFGAQFAVTLNAAGGTLIPPGLAPATSPIAVIIPSLPNDPTNEISPT